MKRVNFTFRTKVTFSNVIQNHSFLLRCTPACNDYQQIILHECRVIPSCTLSSSIDCFGNTLYNGFIADIHDSFEYESTGCVEITGRYILNETLDRIYLYPSHYTAPDASLLSVLQDIMLPEQMTVVEKAQHLSEVVYRSMEYTPASTNVNTTASEALRQGRGVCQDYAHVLIALCRCTGIAARYVAGFMEGEGYTHAWVEFFDGIAWQAIDPTHNRMAESGYVKISHGRDFDDCAIERGIFTGIAEQNLDIMLSVSGEQ